MSHTKNFILVAIVFLLIPISYSYSQEQDESNSESADKPKEVLLKDVLGWIFVPVGTLFGGIIGFLIKRHFNKKDLIEEKRLEHRNWLLRQFNPMAESYYVPLAKFAFDAYNAIKIATTSQDQRAIRTAFQNICIFLTKYIEFKNEKGANFLFHNRNNEQIAIGKFQAILNGLPFDLLMINKIALEMGVNDHKFVTEYTNQEFYDYFKKWIISKHCNKSRQLVLEKLFDLQIILDLSGEEISHGESFQYSLKILDPKKYVASKQNDPFYIISTNKKSIQKEEPLFIFGKGLDNKKITYNFYIDDKKLDVEVHNDENVKLKIPNTIDDGTYDVFAKFKKPEENEDETIGLVVHIISKSESKT